MANEPYGVKHPVAFVPGGDTTRDAFSKHIQEIERIYGQLAELDSHKLESTTLTDTMKEHIDDANPHPNYKPPVPSMGDITGNLDGSRVSGNLSNATIGHVQVTGLKGYIESILPEPEDKGDGVIKGELSKNGYVKFNNGLTVQWGTAEKAGHEDFPVEFSSECFAVIGSLYFSGGGSLEYDTLRIKSWDKSGFDFQAYANSTNRVCTYIAIGK